MAVLKNEGTFWSGSAELHYLKCGRGEPLIMLHGNGEDLSAFSKQLGLFSEHFSVVLLDSRGHGQSAHGNEKLTVDLMAGDVLALMNKLDIPKANVLGFSDGGNIALALALRAPERIIRLVLSGANMDPDGLKLKYLLPMWLKHMYLMAKALFRPNTVFELDLLELMTKQPHFYGCDLHEIKMPVLITAGENDMIRTEHTKYMHRCIDGSELIIFRGGTHFVHLEQPDEYNAAVLKFLTKER